MKKTNANAAAQEIVNNIAYLEDKAAQEPRTVVSEIAAIIHRNQEQPNEEEVALAKNIGEQMDGKILCPRRCNWLLGEDLGQTMSTVGDSENCLFCPHCEMEIEIVVTDCL